MNERKYVQGELSTRWSALTIRTLVDLRNSPRLLKQRRLLATELLDSICTVVAFALSPGGAKRIKS